MTHDDLSDAAVRLQAGNASVDVVPAIGGALASFRVAGVDILRPTRLQALDERNVRAYACYPLVPYSNRIAQARLRIGDSVHELARNFDNHPHAIHGVGWQRPWTVIEQAAERALIAFEHVPRGADARAWPFAFRAMQALALVAERDRSALTMTIAIESRDSRPFPFGLGFHPFFPKRPGTRLGFRADAVYQTDATRLPTRLMEPPLAWRFDPSRAVGDADLDNVFTGFAGRAQILWPDKAIAVDIESDRAMSHLVVYIPPEQDYLAVEPVTHMTDAFNRAAAGQLATGTRTLEPGQSFSCTMRLTVATTDPFLR